MIKTLVDLQIPQIVGGICAGGYFTFKYLRQQQEKKMKYKKNKKDAQSPALIESINCLSSNYEEKYLACHKRDFIYELVCKSLISSTVSTLKEIQFDETLHNLELNGVGGYRHKIGNKIQGVYNLMFKQIRKEVPRDVFIKLEKTVFNMFFKHLNAVISAQCSDNSILDNNYERTISIIVNLSYQLKTAIDETFVDAIKNLNGELTSSDINNLSCNSCQLKTCVALKTHRGKIL